MTNAGQLWTTCADHLRVQVSEATWQAWFGGLRAVAFGEDDLVLAAPSSLVRDRLEDRYLGMLEGAATDVVGRPVRVRLQVHIPEHVPDHGGWDHDLNNRGPAGLGPADTGPTGTGPGGGGRTTADPTGPGASNITPIGAPGSHHLPGGGHSSPAHPAGGSLHTVPTGRPGARHDLPSLNPRYTFEAFVIGSSNRFAHAAAQRVAETPAVSYNPLFVHGDSGLGKTHLLHAIGHYVVQNFPALRVRYVSTETFMNDFVDAIRTNGQTSFKRRYRDCDVLLVDDIQFMEGKEGLQEEFFHTFNSLYEGSKQIVLSSDRHPRSIATLEDRLRSRFEWGLTTDVQPPELETRLAILRKKAETERTPIPGEVLELIATHVRDNIRELEGALIRVSAFASLNREPLTREKAEMVLSDILDANRPRQITPNLIMETVAAAFNFSVDELCGTSRRRPLVNARQIGMYVFRELTDFSYPAIAREFGGRDHTTVIHAVEKVSGLMREKRQTYDQVTELIRTIRGGG